LRVGTVAIGNIFYIQDDFYPRHQDKLSPILKCPYIVEAFLNGQYAAARRSRETGRWENVYAPNRTDLAVVRCLRTDRRKEVLIRTLQFHEELGLTKGTNHYPDLPVLRRTIRMVR
jgi:hypothetical protein